MQFPLILIADDDDNDRFFLRRAFQKLRLLNPTREFHTGDKVIDYLAGRGDFADRTRHPRAEILLTDLHLPHVSGLEVLAWIDENKPEGLRETILWTGTASPAEKAKIAELHGVGPIEKPMSPNDYAEVVATLPGLTLEQTEGGQVLHVAEVAEAAPSA